MNHPPLSTTSAIPALSPEAAFGWQQRVGWLVGCNYTPAYASNQLEMWQQETFDPVAITREIAWARSIGFNSLRVFLHDLLFLEEGQEFLDRFSRFLDIASAQDMGVMPVLFDSVWHAFPRSGRQREPEVGVHNAGWVQSPGVEVLRDAARFGQRRDYVYQTVHRFARDQRIHCWDLWNEPDNPNNKSYGPRDLGESKGLVVAPLLQLAFNWAREAGPTQPLTSGLWAGDWSAHASLKPIERVQIENSDVISFHNYTPPGRLQECIAQLRRYQRPLLCTEYMARPIGSTIESCLPVLRSHDVAAYNWGLVQGRCQTHLPWDSWRRPYVDEPDPWFHELLHPDGRPYRESEIACIHQARSSPPERAHR